MVATIGDLYLNNGTTTTTNLYTTGENPEHLDTFNNISELKLLQQDESGVLVLSPNFTLNTFTLNTETSVVTGTTGNKSNNWRVYLTHYNLYIEIIANLEKDGNIQENVTLGKYYFVYKGNNGDFHNFSGYNNLNQLETYASDSENIDVKLITENGNETDSTFLSMDNGLQTLEIQNGINNWKTNNNNGTYTDNSFNNPANYVAKLVIVEHSSDIKYKNATFSTSISNTQTINLEYELPIYEEPIIAYTANFSVSEQESPALFLLSNVKGNDGVNWGVNDSFIDVFKNKYDINDNKNNY